MVNDPDFGVTLYYNATGGGGGNDLLLDHVAITVYYSTFFDDNFPVRKKITIDSNQVPGDLNDFPLLVNINDPDLSESAQKDGDDIVFTDENGAIQLDHEIEKYDHTAGDLTAWVRIPFLNATEDTIIYMYYGNYTVGNQENPTGVWDKHFMAVYHMGDDPSASIDCTGGSGSFEICDSTSNVNHGDANGALNATDNLVSGQIGNAIQFYGGSADREGHTNTLKTHILRDTHTHTLRDTHIHRETHTL